MFVALRDWTLREAAIRRPAFGSAAYGAGPARSSEEDSVANAGHRVQSWNAGGCHQRVAAGHSEQADRYGGAGRRLAGCASGASLNRDRGCHLRAERGLLPLHAAGLSSAALDSLAPA